MATDGLKAATPILGAEVACIGNHIHKIGGLQFTTYRQTRNQNMVILWVIILPHITGNITMAILLPCAVFIIKQMKADTGNNITVVILPVISGNIITHNITMIWFRFWPRNYRSRILISIVVAAECPYHAFLYLGFWAWDS